MNKNVIKVGVKNFGNITEPKFIVRPSYCEICHTSIFPIELSQHYNKDSKLYSIFYECPSCKQTFISHYKELSSNEAFATFPKSYPRTFISHQFDESINKLSPNFSIIFNQALEAENNNLDQICGIGYRKALEFLIKDFCIYVNSNDEEKIKAMPLGQVIDSYIDSKKIKNLAKASTWLGNDETHYQKKFEDKDINNLKKFIDATVHFITYELVSDEAVDFVSSNS